MSSSQPSAKIRICFQEHAHTYEIPVIPQTTLRQMILMIGLNPEMFECSDTRRYIFVNEGGTIMPFIDRNLIDYNNWYVEKGYISPFYIKRYCDVSNDHLWHLGHL